MGDIYRATDSQLGRTVAIKVLAERFSNDVSLRKRFKREAIAAGGLSSDPHVVTIFDVGEHEGRPFIVMAYLSGGTIADKLREGAINSRQTIEWLRHAAHALDSAHKSGIVHRDVKPANLMLDDNESVHVGDFGIARVLDDSTGGMTEAGTMLGTAGYLAPEQATGEKVVPASDIYALGVVAFEMLTGQRPFRRDSPTAEAAAHVSEQPPAAAQLNPDLPSSVDRVLGTALAKQPAQRYATASEFVDALESALQEDETRVMPTIALAAAGTGDDRYDTRPVAAGGRRKVRPRRSGLSLPMLLAGALLLALAGVALASALDDGTGDGTQARDTTPTPKTVLRQGKVKTVTVEKPTPDEAPANAPGEGSLTVAEARAQNDRAFQLYQEGRYAEAIALAREALPVLRGVRPNEAYANYNLGASLIALGQCDEGLPLIDRSEELQGHRSEFDTARAQCDGKSKGNGNGNGNGNDD